jgi:hypothetical protein
MNRIGLGTMVLACAGLLAQQDPRGVIEGQITDPTGAVVARAAVKIANLATGVVTHVTSNEQGVYEVPYLNPGEYRVEVELAGFKRWARPSLEVRAGERLRIDIRLEVGSISDAIEVTAETPVLQSVESNVGQVLSARQSSELPLRGGSLAWLYTMAPGVVLPSLPAGGPWNVDQASAGSVEGGGLGSFDFNLDGVSSNAYGGRTAFVPPQDMVQELRIDTNSFDASIGHSTGGSVNITLKTGTNRLHGAVGVWLTKGPLVSRNFFSPTSPIDIWWRSSVAVGGPVFLPKIYNGRNRTFWMFGFISHDRSQPVQNSGGVPTEAERGGDFSALLRLGTQYQIYDPFTTTPSGARLTRQPLAGNIIPASRIDPTARALLKFYPLPNAPGTADGLNNYNINVPKDQVERAPVVRIDHNVSDSHRLFARYSQTNFAGQFDQLVPGSNVRGRTRGRPSRGAALDNVWVLSPNWVLDTRYGFSWFQENQSYTNVGYDLKDFAYPASLVSQFNAQAISFPQLTVSNVLQLGNDGGFLQTYYSHSLLNTLSWTRGLHTVRFGADTRLQYTNSVTFGNASPAYTFDQTYTRGPLDNSTNAPTGQGLASFLFGIPSSGGVDLNASEAELSRFYGFFVQDDWRIAKKLTLNLGLRWELETPVTERFNRSTADFDFATPNPIQAQAQAAYAKAPIADVPASAFRTLGGPTFVGTGGEPRAIRETYFGALMPRVGFAYQLTPRTVVRAGYGIFFGLLGADYTDVQQPGFSQRTSIVPTNNSGVTYVASISNPLPNGLQIPLGAAGGLLTYLGRAPGFFSRDGRRPYTQRWSLNVQYEPFKNTLVEIGYLGSKSVRQRVSTQFNAVPAQYLSTSPVRNQPVIDFLSANVANPFLGIHGFEGTSYYTSANTSRSQLLKPYPEFNDLTTGLPAGSAWYNALTLRVDRRFAHGFLVQGNYTWSRTMQAVSYLNATDSIPEHMLSNLDRPHRINISGVWELPIGKGKALLRGTPGWLDHFVGGWQAQAIFTWQSGPPLAFGNVIFTCSSYNQLQVPAGQRSIKQWFNTGCFQRASNLQLANNIVTFPAAIGQVRSPGINIWDLSAFKNFRIREGLKVQLRGEAEGALNHPNFSTPNVNPVNTLFGTISSTQSGEGERRVFVGVKVLF